MPFWKPTWLPGTSANNSYPKRADRDAGLRIFVES